MKCENCNIELNTDNTFCPNCGKNVAENLNSIIPNETNYTNQNNTQQVLNNDIQYNTPVYPVNNNTEMQTESSLTNNVELEIPVQSISNNMEIQTESSLTNNVELGIPVQPVNNSPEIQTENPLTNNVELEISSQNFQPEINEVKRKKPIIIPLIILIILILFVGVGIFFYKTILTKQTPKEVFITAIDNIFDNTTTLLNQNNDIINGKTSLKINLKSDDGQSEIFDMINKIFINLEYNIDYNKKIASLTFNSTYENSELLKSNIYFENSKGYILLNDIYDKYISTNVEEYDDMFTKIEYTSDHQTIIKEIQKSITSSLKDEYFVKEETDGIVKNILFINYKNGTELSKNILTYLNNSAQFKESLSKLEDKEIKEITDFLNDGINQLNELEETSDVIKLAIYIDSKNKEIIKFEFEVQEENVSKNIIVIDKKDDKYTFKYFSENEEVFSATAIIKTEEDNTNIKFSTKINGISVGLDINYYMKYNTTINKIDTNNSVDFNTLTEEDYTKIYENLTNNDGIKKLITAYEEIFGNIIDNTKCSVAINCQEGNDGMMNCQHYDSNSNLLDIECKRSDITF